MNMCRLRHVALATALLAGVAAAGSATAQGWGGGDRGGYGQNPYGDRGGRANDWNGGDRADGYRRGGDNDRRGGDDDRRGGDYDRRGGDYERRGGDYDRRGWDGDRRRPGWGGGGYGPGGPAGAHWWRGRWWNQGAGPCWRWSPWRQNWKWVCD